MIHVLTTCIILCTNTIVQIRIATVIEKAERTIWLKEESNDI